MTYDNDLSLNLDFSPWFLFLEQDHGKGQAPPTPRLKLWVRIGGDPICTLVSKVDQ